jgi:hypothetical protein
MRPSRWPIQRTIPLLVVSVIAVGAATARPPALAAATPPACSPDTGPSSAGPSAGAWWRLDAALDEDGMLVGQVLHAGGRDGRSYRIGLPPESFASGPVHGQVLIGADDDAASVLSLLDVIDGCTRTVGTERAVVRRAIVDPAGSAVFEFHVDRRTRADLGVWRRDLAAGSRPIRVLGALPADGRFGITWTTELDWSADGRLIVGSCGAAACRTRILDPASGVVVTVAEPDLGEPLGIADGRLVSYLACRGLPCPIVAVDLRGSGHRSVLTDAGPATLGDVDGRTVLVHEPLDRVGTVEVVSLSGVTLRRMDVGRTMRLVSSASRSRSAIEMASGWVAVAGDGRIGALRTTDAVHLRDGRISPAAEVAP